MYSSYTAEQIARTYELADLHRVNLLGSVTWAFEFEDQPYFDGFRDLATNGIAKPVLNVFRMLGQMGGDRVAVESSGAAAARDGARRRRARARRHHRAREPPGAGGRGPRLELSRRRPARAGCRRDPDHRGPARRVSRSRTTASIASTATPTRRGRRWGRRSRRRTDQLAALEKAGALYEVGPTRTGTTAGELSVTFPLPRQGVSLVKLTW